MAAPVNKPCPHDTSTIVALNVTSADVRIMTQVKKYYSTYVLTGAGAPVKPTDPEDPTGLWIRIYDGYQFRTAAAADLYIYCDGQTEVTGNVRIDT